MGNRQSQDGSNSKGVCEKIFSSLCPNFQTNQHAHHKQYAVPASSAPNTSLPTHDHTSFSNSIQIKLTNSSGAEAASTGLARMPKAVMRMEDNDAFSDYINRARLRIQAMSNVGMEKIASRSTDDEYDARKEDNTKDAFSDYINRAKMRIRKTSSIGSRKIFSFKRE
ncbi:hypothetical protein C1H46_012204 [Malus baccata]|uniref:Uncharacterized protein n=1 Tax=Malus baccata TaxID=106549 RepID=A0A540MVD5_MALBA|nr:hypothetical protein C1H46_012204 [Malus baccata]